MKAWEEYIIEKIVRAATEASWSRQAASKVKIQNGCQMKAWEEYIIENIVRAATEASWRRQAASKVKI